DRLRRAVAERLVLREVRLDRDIGYGTPRDSTDEVECAVRGVLFGALAAFDRSGGVIELAADEGEHLRLCPAGREHVERGFQVSACERCRRFRSDGDVPLTSTNH